MEYTDMESQRIVLIAEYVQQHINQYGVDAIHITPTQDEHIRAIFGKEEPEENYTHGHLLEMITNLCEDQTDMAVAILAYISTIWQLLPAHPMNMWNSNSAFIECGKKIQRILFMTK